MGETVPREKVGATDDRRFRQQTRQNHLGDAEHGRMLSARMLFACETSASHRGLKLSGASEP
jgi:hypothetical protein